MNLSSPKIEFDKRLIAVEELFRQRQYKTAVDELQSLENVDFTAKDYEYGLFLSLSADAEYFLSNYKKSIEYGLKSARLLADFPLNQRYGRIQLIMSKAYAAIGDLKNAEIRARDSLASYRRCGDAVGQANALNELARLSFIRCNYKDVSTFLEEALSLAHNDQRKVIQLSGNLARIHIFTGEWEKAEREINEVIEFNIEHGEEISHALNLLTLGYLQMRLRRFILSAKSLDKALEIISRLELKREKVIYLEYAGELAFERGDIHKAKSLLSKAYEQGLVMAPGSSLVSQSVRRLAEVELQLDNFDEAMRLGQKALDAATHVGEKVEIGLAKKIIAQIFSAKQESDEACTYIDESLDIIRAIGDPLELGRTLLTYIDIASEASVPPERIQAAFEEMLRLFNQLGLDYWLAETNFKYGQFACQRGNLSEGFKALSKAERVYADIADAAKLRSVSKFLKSLSEQAVALSVSHENEFKIFGNLITPNEISDIKSSRLDSILQILLKRTGADRALVYLPDNEEDPLSASFSISSHQASKFMEHFKNMMGEEISRSKPTILLDCRRDPFVNELFSDMAEAISSVIVVPFKVSDNMVSYLYLDKLSLSNTLNPFSQADLNFAVAYSDIIAFKWAEIQKNKLLEDNLRLRDQLREKAAFPNIITKNPNMLDILAQVRQIINSNISISIEGETGSGKDVLARAIHYNSNRRDKRFISVNCAALPETLLESELFGYKRGAFTGADRDKPGLFEEADGGTFFLDEIGDMPLSIQAKVLRILEEKELVRLGETSPRKVDVRILSATNLDLKEQMAAKAFRQDLYYRLSALTFRLPALRERKDDIPLLIEHFLNESGKKVTPDVIRLLVGYDWPGNVRELENEVKKMALLSGDNEEIPAEVVSLKIANREEQKSQDKAQTVAVAEELVFDDTYGLYDYLAFHEKEFIIKALKESRGVKKHAADVLHIPESTLRLKIKQYNIDFKQFKK